MSDEISEIRKRVDQEYKFVPWYAVLDDIRILLNEVERSRAAQSDTPKVAAAD